jgi:hypothetical protein
VVKAVGGEVLVYDLARQRAHSLNATAAAVWRACTGSRTHAAIATHAAHDLGRALEPAVVDYALSQLDRAHLLVAPGRAAGRSPLLTRRDLIRRGVVAAAIPVVASIVAPRAADAQSGPQCLALGASCPTFGVSGECCSGFCEGECCTPEFDPCTSSEECCFDAICNLGICVLI